MYIYIYNCNFSSNFVNIEPTVLRFTSWNKLKDRCTVVMSMFVSSKWQRVALPTPWRASVQALFYCYLTFLDHRTNISAHWGASAHRERQTSFKIVTWTTKQTWTKHHNTVGLSQFPEWVAAGGSLQVARLPLGQPYASLLLIVLKIIGCSSGFSKPSL